MKKNSADEVKNALNILAELASEIPNAFILCEATLYDSKKLILAI